MACKIVLAKQMLFGLEVKCSREVLEVLAKILHRVMAEMILMHCVDVVEGEVFNDWEHTTCSTTVQ